MWKPFRQLLSIFIHVLLLTACNTPPGSLKNHVRFTGYPSGSGIEYYDGKFYVLGDDATYLLVLDSNFNEIDSVLVDSSQAKRIPKDIKPDYEAMGMNFGSQRSLLMLGSGSLVPYRNKAIQYDPVSKNKTEISLTSFYDRLKSAGLPELNIEGYAMAGGSAVLVNRGHKGYPKNHLIIADLNFITKQNSPFSFILVGANNDTSSFQGVSGLTYARKSDKLIMTVSTEDTRSTYEDGAIGKSYLWIVDNFSSKKRWTSINPNRIINLESIDAAFRGNKIESACVIKETPKKIELALVADNDNGSTMLFRISISK